MARLRLEDFDTLRYLFRALYLGIVSMPRFPTSSKYALFEDTLADIDRFMSITLPASNNVEFGAMREGFSGNLSLVEDFIGTLDGLAIRMTNLRTKQVPNPFIYFKRKGLIELSMQGLCDHHVLFFLCVSPHFRIPL